MSEEVVKLEAMALVLEALQSMQDRQDGMCQAEWRAIGKKAAQYYDLRRSTLSADNSKCTWDGVYAQLSKTRVVAARTKVLNDASKAPYCGRQAPHMPVTMAFSAQAEHQLAFAAFTQKQYEQLSLEEYELAMMAAHTAPAATVEEFKAHINTGRPLSGGPGLLFKGQQDAPQAKLAFDFKGAKEQKSWQADKATVSNETGARERVPPYKCKG